MRQIYFLLLALILNIMANSQDRATLQRYNAIKPQYHIAGQQEIEKPVEDPYFVKGHDTMSTYGPDCITRNILQDKKGNYWFATWQGIVGYDGKVFTNYTLRDGLIKFHVVSVMEDSKGNIWFGTVRGGLYQYDGSSFTLFTTKDGLAGNLIHCMLQDKEGNIWFGTDGGVSRYDGKAFTNFTKTDGLAGIGVWTMLQDRTGKIWFGCLNPDKVGEGGISCYDGHVFADFKNKEDSAFKNVTVITQDKTGNIWIGTREGLSRYDPVSRSLTVVLSNFVGQMLVDREGYLWLSISEPNTHYSKGQYPYNQYLCRYDGKSFKRITEKYDPGDTQVFGIVEDKRGDIWFGTMHGPCRYDGNVFH